MCLDAFSEFFTNVFKILTINFLIQNNTTNAHSIIMTCKTCGGDVAGSHLGVRLTLVCENCVYSEELVTRQRSLRRVGGRAEHLKHINFLDKTNAVYTKGPRSYVCEEVSALARVVKETVEREKKANDVKENQVKKARLNCFINRLASLDGAEPTPGLVSGDFCSTKTKRPVVGTRLLVKRRALWNRCAHVNISTSVQVFNWATSNKKLDTTVSDALLCIDQERNFLDRIATVEGHRVLGFLDETERLALLRINATFEETRHGLPVKTMTPELLGVCEKLADRMDTPFERIVAKLDQSKDCWFYKYMYRMTPRRLSCILAPHFLRPSEKQAMLISDRDESFSRWGLSISDHVGYLSPTVDYFGSDSVDVELYSASRYLAKHHFHQDDLDLVTLRVMNEPGLTWVTAIKEYVEKELVTRKRRSREYSERRRMRREDKSFRTKVQDQYRCRCGNRVGTWCSTGLCGNCCKGPCAGHRII